MSERLQTNGRRTVSVRFHVGILILFLVVIAIFSGIVLVNTYRESARVARKTAVETFTRASDTILERLNLVVAQAEVVAETTSRIPSASLAIDRDGLSHERLGLILSTLAKRQSIYSIYFGYPDGDFLQVIAPRGNPEILAQRGAPPETAFVVRAISEDWAARRTEYWRFLDAAHHVVGARTNHSPSYDPRRRPWYGPALSTDDVLVTAPYLFDSLHQFGITFAHRFPDRGGVVGVDFAFLNMRDFLHAQRLSKNGALFLFDEAGRLISSSSQGAGGASGGAAARSKLPRSDDTLFRTAVGLRERGLLGVNQFVDIDGAPQLFRISALRLGNGSNIYVAAVGPLSDFTAYISRMQRHILMVTVIVLIALFPVVSVLTRRLSRAFETLADDAVRIQRFEFVEQPVIRTIIREVDQLAAAFATMKRTIRQRTEQLEDTREKLEKLVERSISLSAEKDIQRLYALVLQTARELSLADGAILMLLDQGEVYCEMATIGGRHQLDLGRSVWLPTVSVPAPEDRRQDIIGGFVAGGPTASVEDVAAADDPLVDAIRAFDDWAGYQSRSLLIAPLRPSQGVVTGLIVLMNARDKDGQTVPFPPEAFGFVESLASQVAIVEEVRHYQLHLEDTVRQRTAELEDALDVIGDSIRYASRIQRSLLPDATLLRDAFAESFVLWEPRDIVGGDIYWCRGWGRGTLLIVADCTGHGVPGGFMSVIATGALQQGLRTVAPGDTAALTSYMHRYIQLGLKQDGPEGEADDGLELAMLYLPDGVDTLRYTGAGLPLFCVDGGRVEQVRGGRKGLGYRGIALETAYGAETVAAPPGRRFYLTTDGLTQQVGGAKGRSFGKRRFARLIGGLGDVPLPDQGDLIRAELAAYQGEQARRDDVTVVGFTRRVVDGHG